MRALKWVLISLGVVIVLAGLVTLVGAVLPASHVASRTIALRRSPDTVWATVSDLSRYADWWDDVERVDALPDRDGRPVWNVRMTTGPIPLEVTEEDPPRRLVTTIADEDLPFGGTWTYELHPAGDGTRVTVTEDGVIRSPFFRFMARFVFGHAATIESYLEGLARHYGEDAAFLDE